MISSVETATAAVSESPERIFRRTPDVEVVEDSQALWIEADMPGVAPGDVEVTLDDGTLTMRGRARHGSNGNTIVTEFARRFSLRDPGRYDTEQIHATVRNGTLALRIPRGAAAQRRQVPVTVN
jgi:HSP20 family protein